MFDENATGISRAPNPPAVVNVLRDADLPVVDATLPSAPADPNTLDELAERWGIRSSIDRLAEALAR